jgi:Tol biopolymer transport system component
MKSMLGLALAVAIAASAASAQSAQDAERRFKAAMNTELVDGNLKAAIEEYQKVVQSGNRPLAAQALLRIAECYQKLGDAQARSVYERLTRDYADQEEAVAIARAHLAGTASPRVRQVWADADVDDSGSLSPDGRWLTYANWQTGDLGLRDLVNGTNKSLTHTGGWVKSGGEFAQDSRFSPDGKRIAYNWFKPRGAYDLRVMNADGSGARSLGWTKGGEIAPLAWSPDGAHILAFYYGMDGLVSLHLVNAASGQHSELLPAARRYINGASFSPDGKWIALDLPGADTGGSQDADLYIMPVGGGKPEKLETNPAHDVKPLWSSDGNSIFFMSNRGGSWGLWRVPVRNGRAAGTAQLVRGQLGNNVNSIGLSSTGSLFYTLSFGGIDVYAADFDPRTARRTSEPVLLSERYPGTSQRPKVSPDGRFLAYVAQTGSSAPDGWVVVVREQGSGRTPDSRKILLETVGQRPNSRDLMWLDPVSGSIAAFRSIEPTRNPFNSVFSPDGRTLYMTFRPWVPPAETWQVIAVDVATGDRRELYKTDRTLNGLALSPAGDTLVTIRQASVWNTRGEQDYELVMIPSAGGPAKVATTIRAEVARMTGSLTPDGTRVLIALGGAPPNQIELVSIDLSTGRMEPAGLRQNRLNSLMIDSSGKRLLFSAGSRKSELWVAENILATK